MESQSIKQLEGNPSGVVILVGIFTRGVTRAIGRWHRRCHLLLYAVWYPLPGVWPGLLEVDTAGVIYTCYLPKLHAKVMFKLHEMGPVTKTLNSRQCYWFCQNI